MITLVGAVVILASLLFFFNDALMLYLFVFSVPFSAASILILPGSKFGVQPSYYLGLFLIAKVLIKLLRGNLLINTKQKMFLGAIGAFLALSLVSLLYPLLLNYFNVNPVMINPLLAEPTRLSGIPRHALTYSLYMVFFVGVAVSVMFEVRTYERLVTSIKVLLGSALFTAIWALVVQYPSIIFKFPYPYWLFNNHQGYGQSWGTIFPDWALVWSSGGFLPKFSSVAPESSMYAFFLMPVIALLFGLNINKKYLFFGRVAQTSLLLLLLVVNLLSLSSSAYLGTFFIFLAVILFYSDPVRLINLKIARPQVRLLAIALGVSLLVVLASHLLLWFFQMDYGQLFDIIGTLTIHKFSGGSGADRAVYFSQGMGIFYDTYLLGSGWGVNRTTDFASTMLANVGVLGLLSYLIMIILPLTAALSAYRRLKIKRPAYAHIALSLAFSFVTLVFLMFISVPDFIFMHYWLIFGLLLSLPMIKDSLQRQEEV